MIFDLKLALDMRSRLNVSEVVVSPGVFLRVLQESELAGDRGSLVLNRPHASLTYPFLHKATWKGLTFICLSMAPFGGDRRRPAGDPLAN